MVFSKQKHVILVALFIASLFITLPVKAEQKVSLAHWDVHYIAFNSTFLTPEIAKQYGILRSKFNGVINISILDKQDQSAQEAVLTGTAKNLLGVVKKLSFKQVQEGQAIYYLAVLPFSDQEQYRISVDINDGKINKTLKFQHKFYAE
nr:DUF4426 domain-containing protein [Paraglaciecola sp. G1-23]